MYLRTAPGEASQSSCMVLWVTSIILNSPDGGRGTIERGEIQKKNKKTDKRWESDTLQNIPAEGKKALLPPTGHPLISERVTGVIAVQGEDGNTVGRVGTKFLQLDISNCSFHTHLWKSTTSQMKGMVDPLMEESLTIVLKRPAWISKLVYSGQCCFEERYERWTRIFTVN